MWLWFNLIRLSQLGQCFQQKIILQRMGKMSVRRRGEHCKKAMEDYHLSFTTTTMAAMQIWGLLLRFVLYSVLMNGIVD
jgi:hypothetical protein